jgi:NitT/TauT family transport system permease protein
MRALGRGLLTAAVMVALWEVVYLVWQPKDYIFASPVSVAESLVDRRKLLLEQTWHTTYETVLGFLIAVVLGVALAAVHYLFRRLARVLWPSILFVQIMPKVAIAPLLLVWLGFGAATKVVIAFLIAFFAVMANAYRGLDSAGPELIELGRSMGARRASIFFRMELPNALPEILSGARIAVTFALVGTVVAELVGSNNGLGNVVLTANQQLDTSLMFAAVVMLAALGLTLYALVGLIERRLVPWHASLRSREAVAARRIAGSF